ncbi:MAG: thioredoxin domain-containing protein [Nitrospirales bacterium]|nr:thioredoxin domain-containing protein [Nitrospirales bacterium]
MFLQFVRFIGNCTPFCQFWRMIIKFAFAPVTEVMNDLCRTRGGSRLWMLAGLSAWLLVSSVHAEIRPHEESVDHPIIQWHEWGNEAFGRAQAEDKLIILDLTAVWCHACHVMDQTTYANPRIAQLLNAKFIPVRVDTDQRPDLDARYRAGGWPTINVLLPTGEILFQANALGSEEMEAMLLEVQSIYVTDKGELLKQASQLWERVKEKVKAGPSRENVLQASMAKQSVDMMRAQFDAVNGGFRDAPKFFEPEAIQMVFAYGFFEDDPELLKIGLDTLKKQVRLLDPVWGGFYRYAEQADWTQPHFEKMLSIQALNLRNYVEAFQLTGDPQFKRIALALIEYVSRFLTDPQTGLLYESQDADVRGTEGEALISGAEYYSFNESKRLATGTPYVDQRIFTGSNSLMAWAYLHASLVLEKVEIGNMALQILSRLFEKRFDLEKGLAHVETRGVPSLYGLLSDHVLFGQALLEAFRVTGRSQFLQNAEALAEVSRRLLHDSVNGGFFDHPQTSGKLGLLKFPTKPVKENLQAALWYLDLFHLTGKQPYRFLAENALQTVVMSRQPLPLALSGLAIDQWFRIPIHIAVVGDFDDAMTKILLLEGQRMFCPGKIVKGFDPKEGQPKWGDINFPYDERPVAFVCTDRMCSAPVFHAEAMEKSVSDMMAVLRDPVQK